MKKIIGFKLPLESGHKVRGVGFYTQHLLDNLLKIVPDNINITPFTQTIPKDVDLIHYTYFDLFRHSLPILKPAKTIVTILDVVPLEFPDHYPPGIKGNLNYLLQRIALSNVSHILTISNFSKDQIHKQLNINPSKITVTHLGVDSRFKKITKLQLLKTIRNRYKLPPEFVLYVGDINWNKNIINLTQACVEANVKLVIVGKGATNTNVDLDHPELTHFKLWLKLYEHHPNIYRIGFVPDQDLPVIYNLASLYCHPSLSEGFGLPLLEAMSCGTPCIASNKSSLPEIGRDALLYFDPEKTIEIKQLIKKLFNNSLLSKELGNRCIAQAKKFKWINTARETIKIYEAQLQP